MNKIKLLSPDQAQKIAAGEVVERPANIVKELLENSLDAGATQISLYIEQAGKQLIRIIDNGCGMSPDDALLSFLPHATSKITSIDQLESISSFGFRGEALASISAVSKVTLVTKQADFPSGLHIKYTDGMLQERKEVACNNGTDLSIADLFYNLPVRKKFLKQDETEWNQIQQLFNAFCISHPTIFFKLFHDNKLIISAPPVTNLKDRITQLWDFNFSQQLLPLQTQIHTPDWLSVSGYTSNQHFWRHGKHNIYFFVNDRWIKNPELSKAILKGYFNVLPPGKFPAAFIILTIDKNLVDINCHPKKEEVRFIKPGSVATAITTIIKQTLEQTMSRKIEHIVTSPEEKQIQAPNLAFCFAKKPMYEPENRWDNDSIQHPHRPWEDKFDTISLQANTPHEQNLFPRSSRVFCESEAEQNVSRDECGEPRSINEIALQSPSISPEPEITPNYSGPIIGQLFKTYILIDNDNELIVIDQHAAHERILYEKFLKNFEYKEGTQLLFPEVIQLTKENLTLVLAEKEFFAQQGIELEQISGTEVIIKTAPPQLNNTPLKEFIHDVLAFIEEHDQLDHEIFRKKLNEHVHSHMACKAAIKAGDTLTLDQMSKLVQDLYKTEKRFICVHGRPTIWSIDKLDIEKHFRRK